MITRELLLYSDIDTIKSLCLTTRYNDFCNDYHFWLDKFEYDGLFVINKQNTLMGWINEYKRVTNAINKSEYILSLVNKYDIGLNINQIMISNIRLPPIIKQLMGLYHSSIYNHNIISINLSHDKSESKYPYKLTYIFDNIDYTLNYSYSELLQILTFLFYYYPDIA